MRNMKKMKKAVIQRKTAAMLMSTALTVGLISTLGQPATVQAYNSNPEIRTVNLGTTGIKNPEEATDKTSKWSNGAGSYVYFGDFYQSDANTKEAIKWRVLDIDNDSTGNNNADSLLLLSDKALDVVKFNEDQSDGKSWAGSNIKKWLNSQSYSGPYTSGGFLDTAFNNVEQTAIKPTTKAAGQSISGLGDSLNSPSLNGEKIFMLSAEEASTAAYGFMDVHSLYEDNQSLLLGTTPYAIRVGNRLIDSSGHVRWWLRSAVETRPDRVGSVDQKGWLSYYFVDDAYITVNPALNLDLSSILFNVSAGTKKSDFGETAPSNSKEWNLTLQGGRGFQAEAAASNDIAAGDDFKVDVTNIGSANGGVNYDRLSAILVDQNGTAIDYGRVKDVAETGQVKVTIPANTPLGSYSLMVFAEDTNDANSADYASNMAVMPLNVIAQQNPSATDLDYNLTDYIYDKTEKKVSVSPKNKHDMGKITVKYNGETTAPINAGTYNVTVDISGNPTWNKVENMELGTFKINPKPLHNVSAQIPNVTLNSSKTLEDQILPLESADIEDGDIVNGVCDITFTQTSTAGNHHTASVKVKSLTNSNYIFTGTLENQNYTVLQKSLIGMELKQQPNKLTYRDGEKLDLSGIIVTLLYDDGTKEDITFENFTKRNISVQPTNQTVLSTSKHHGKPVTVICDSYSVYTQTLTVTAENAVKTADSTSVLPWIVFAGLSMLALALIVSHKHKSSNR